MLERDSLNAKDLRAMENCVNRLCRGHLAESEHLVAGVRTRQSPRIRGVATRAVARGADFLRYNRDRVRTVKSTCEIGFPRTQFQLTRALPAECPHGSCSCSPQFLALRLAHADVSERARPSLASSPCMPHTRARPPRRTRETAPPTRPATGKRYDKSPRWYQAG